MSEPTRTPHPTAPVEPLLPVELSDPTALPLAQQTAWQRWELASFGDNRPTAVARAAAEKAARAAITAQLSEQIAHSREQAHAEGYAAGLLAGRADGQAQGLDEGRQAALAERACLTQLAEGLSSELTRMNELIAQDLLTLALDIAKAMLKTALDIKPELVLPVVQQALAYLPAVQLPAQLILHPKDAALVRAHIGGELASLGWQIREDPQLTVGGCRIETACNQIDASAPSRWQRIAAALGSQSAWLQD